MSTLELLLQQQDEHLEALLSLLAQEFSLLQQRQALALPQLTAQKQQLLEKIQQQDQVILQHPDATQLDTTLAPLRHSLSAKLTLCQERNDVNGKLIELNLVSNRRLATLLAQLRGRNCVTYDNKGNTRPSNGNSVGIKA